MARKRGRRRKSVSGYFRKLFEERPEWLQETSNAVILDRWRADHGKGPDDSVPGNIKANLANIKSVLRGKQRGAGNMAAAVAPRGTRGFDALEEMIDDSISLAKNLDREGLAGVIDVLRSARNKVVWKMGE